MADTIKELIKAVYIAGVSSGAGKELSQEEIIHRKKALDLNPIMPEALAEIKRIIEEAKPGYEIGEPRAFIDGYNSAIDEYHNNLLRVLEG